MTGKEKCEYLKHIRRNFARSNGIDFEPAVCTHSGECSGHCPACDKEVEELFQLIREHTFEGQAVQIDVDDLFVLGEDNIRKEFPLLYIDYSELTGLPF